MRSPPATSLMVQSSERTGLLGPDDSDRGPERRDLATLPWLSPACFHPYSHRAIAAPTYTLVDGQRTPTA